MKNLYLLFFLVAFPFILLAQNIHGIWTGTLVNDSTHAKQNFELGLSEYRGKITGYTYTTFINNDTFYYSIKRIKGERRDGKLIIEDVEMVGNNFPQRASKGVKQTTVFSLINDSTIDVANGSWSTNQTKKFYSIRGSATVREQQNEQNSDLMAHLQEMHVKTDIAARQSDRIVKSDEIAKYDPPTSKNPKRTVPEKSPANAGSTAPATVNSSQSLPGTPSNVIKENNTVTQSQVSSPNNKLNGDRGRENSNYSSTVNPGNSAINTQIGSAQSGSANTASNTAPIAGSGNISPDKNQEEKKNDIAGSGKALPGTKTQTTPTKTNEPMIAGSGVNGKAGNQRTEGNKTIQQPGVVQQPVTNSTVPSNNSKPAQTVSASKPLVQPAGTVQANQKAAEPLAQGTNNQTQKNINPVVVNGASPESKLTIGKTVSLPSSVAGRKNENIQDIYFTNDSLVLSLYDNGIVDGDTVSVFLNGENILSKQKLREAATKKTVYISPHTDSVQLVLFADNLGSIPPNTGLLTVRDGEEVYQVRFSADLQKNASIFLRRKKDQ